MLGIATLMWRYSIQCGVGKCELVRKIRVASSCSWSLIIYTQGRYNIYGCNCHLGLTFFFGNKIEPYLYNSIKLIYEIGYKQRPISTLPRRISKLHKTQCAAMKDIVFQPPTNSPSFENFIAWQASFTSAGCVRSMFVACQKILM